MARYALIDIDDDQVIDRTVDLEAFCKDNGGLLGAVMMTNMMGGGAGVTYSLRREE